MQNFTRGGLKKWGLHYLKALHQCTFGENWAHWRKFPIDKTLHVDHVTEHSPA